MRRTWPTVIALTLNLACLLPAIAWMQSPQRGQPPDPPSRHVITGRVVDGAGSGVAGTFVTALEPSEGDTSFRPVSARLHATTNALGEYRLEGLNAGVFYVI